MRTHLKKHKAVKKKVFYFYQNNTPMHLVFQSMYVVFDLAKKMFKDYCPPPPPPIHPERGWDQAIINKLLRIMGTYFLPNFGEIHYVISER